MTINLLEAAQVEPPRLPISGAAVSVTETSHSSSTITMESVFGFSLWGLAVILLCAYGVCMLLHIVVIGFR